MDPSRRPSRRNFIGATLAAAGAALAELTPARALAGSRRKKKRDAPLFEDHFKRRDRDGWGAPWFNQRYHRQWGVRSERGIFRLPGIEFKIGYRPNPVLVLDRDVAGIDLRSTVSVSNASSRVGLVARAVGYADYYAVYLGPGSQLRISRCGPHHENPLAKKKVPFGANRRYRLRMQVRGRGPVRLRAKVWPAGTPEPLQWAIEVVDAAPEAITTPGAFGMYFMHATDRRASAFRVVDFVARSNEKGTTTPPAVAFGLAGPPVGSTVQVVAKTAVPSRVRFEVASDPTFGQVVQTFGPIRTGRALTAKGFFDTSGFGNSSFVYWRAVAERQDHIAVGPIHKFRTPPGAGLPVRFAFGSCTKWQAFPKTSFDQARLKLPDLYLHQGDFGYVPTKVVAHAPDTYQDHWTRMQMDPSFSGLARETPIALLRDDADYGRNRADSDSVRRFTIGAHDEINANPGPYFETRFGDVAIFNIDCRRYSTGKDIPPEHRSKLGAEQKAWLKESMSRAAEEDVGLLILSSPQAFGSDANRESWRGGYLFEWSELVDFFQDLGAPVLIVSGDAHGHRLHEYPQKNLQANVPRIVEIVSSGTEQNKFFDEVDPQFLLKKAKGSGFGLVELSAEQSVGNQRTRTLTLTAVRTADGSPFWTASYLIVKGLGILPILSA